MVVHERLCSALADAAAAAAPAADAAAAAAAAAAATTADHLAHLSLCLCIPFPYPSDSVDRKPQCALSVRTRSNRECQIRYPCFYPSAAAADRT